MFFLYSRSSETDMERTDNNWIYPGRELCFVKETKKLSESNISERNKELIRQFQNHLFARGSKESRVAKVSSQLRNICEDLAISIDTANVKHITAVVAALQNKRFVRKQLNGASINEKKRRYSEATIADYCRVIKQFFLWFKDEDERVFSPDPQIAREARSLYKYIEKELKTSYKDPFRDPNEVIQPEEIQLVLAKGCESLRDQAFLKLLHSHGSRIGEHLNIRLKHIRMDKMCAEIVVSGKTGQRSLFVTDALPYLSRYLEVHPCRNDPESFLWIGESNRYGSEPIAYRGACKLIDRAFKKANVTKRHSLHWFRHSRATLWALQYDIQIVEKLMGWVPGSKQSKRYVHFSNRDIRKAFLEKQGLVTGELLNKELPKSCVCGATNDQVARYCHICGKALSVVIAYEDGEKYNKELNATVAELMAIVADPERLRKFQEFKAKQGGAP